MNLLSEIISKPVLNLYTGKIEGTLKNACIDDHFKKIKWFKMFDDDEEEYLVDTKKIFCIGDLVLIKNSEALTIAATVNNAMLENNPINLDVFSLSGNFVGKLTDIEINDKFEIENFITEKTKISQKKIINIGDSIVINDSAKKVKNADFRPKMKVNTYKNNDNIITIMPRIEEPDGPQEFKEISLEKIEKKFIVNKQPLPAKITGNGNFLIGRKVLKTIYGINNEVIIKKDNLINSKNLENAKKHSKLVELAVYSQIKA